jgi:hypothetical protein
VPARSDVQRAVVGLRRVNLNITRPLDAQWSSRPEQQIQRAAIRAASTVFAFHPANGGWRTRVEAAILKAMGVKAGVPDVIAIEGGRCYALELKASGGRLTPVQRDAHAALVAAGATVAVAYGLDDALARLEAWGLLRGSCQGRRKHNKPLGDCHDDKGPTA